MKGLVAALLALATVCLPALSTAQVIVDYDGFAGSNKIQDGIDAAPDGGEVYVISSISTTPVVFSGPGNRELDFHGKNIRLTAFGGNDTKIIDGGGAFRAVNLSAGIDSTSLIEGFTFRNCHSSEVGGAIMCAGGAPLIADCVFHDNSASHGAAIAISEGTTRISSCIFYSNSATVYGGAIHVSDSDLGVSACTLSDNDAARGGGLAAVNSSLSATRCTFANNEGSYGSGIWLQGGTAVIEQCVLAFGTGGSGLWGGNPETFHCCVYGNDNGDDLYGDAHDNIITDPLFCDLYGDNGGNVSLCSNSPCLPILNPWTLQVGSRAQGCADCDSPVVGSTWGSIKSLYR